MRAIDAPPAGREAPRHKCEDGGLARAISAHDRKFGPPPHGEVHLVENRFVMPIFERDVVKAYNTLFTHHGLVMNGPQLP